MSVYDTIRCIWHDPAYLVREHDDLLGGLAVLAIVLLWAAL